MTANETPLRIGARAAEKSISNPNPLHLGEHPKDLRLTHSLSMAQLLHSLVYYIE
jgi:hypothetical protein